VKPYRPVLIESLRLWRSSPIDPMELEAWPLAAAIEWIRVRHLSEEQSAKRVRFAFHYDCRIFREDDFPLAEGRLLLDAGLKREITIYYSEGELPLKYLGPESQIEPIGPRLCIETGSIDVKRPVSVAGVPGCLPYPGNAIDSIWCLRPQVQALWPSHPMIQPEQIADRSQDCEAYSSSGPEPSQRRKKKPGRGRRKNSGTFPDNAALDRMEELLKLQKVPSVYAAAVQILPIAFRQGAADKSIIRRHVQKYNASDRFKPEN
jgi:hypothetical protein